MNRRQVICSVCLGMAAGAFRMPLARAGETAKPKFAPDEAMAKLLSGNQRYVSGRFQQPDVGETRRRQLPKGQSPFASILGCADSRVPPEYVFDAGLGELFTDRVAGNTVSPPMLGSIEFSVSVLHVPVLLVLGHEKCGAVTAAVDVFKTGKVLAPALMAMIEPIRPAVVAVKSKPGDLLTNAVQENARMTAMRLLAEPSISQPVQAGHLKVAAGYYSLDDGSVTILTG